MNLDGGGGSISSGVKILQNQTMDSCQAACECSPYCVGIQMEYNATNNYSYTGKCHLENWLQNHPGQSQYYLSTDIGGVFFYREAGQVSENPCTPSSAPTETGQTESPSTFSPAIQSTTLSPATRPSIDVPRNDSHQLCVCMYFLIYYAWMVTIMY